MLRILVLWVAALALVVHAATNAEHALTHESVTKLLRTYGYKGNSLHKPYSPPVKPKTVPKKAAPKVIAPTKDAPKKAASTKASTKKVQVKKLAGSHKSHDAIPGQFYDQPGPLDLPVQPQMAQEIQYSKPRYRSGATRVKIRYGPMNLPSTKDKNFEATTLFVSGMFDKMSVGIRQPCVDCTLLYMQAGMEYADGSDANIDTGSWLHHIVLISKLFAILFKFKN
jgi:hypothetical protein